MEVPLAVKDNVRTLLLSRMGGIFMDHICEEYQRLFSRPLPFRELGYSNIEALLRSVPDTARLEYVIRERRMKVHGVAKFIFSKNDRNWQSPMPLLNTPNRKVEETQSVKSGGDLNQPTGVKSGSGPLDVWPDHRGLYTVCFPASLKPMELAGTLEDMMSVAGRVAEIYETVRWVYICYTDLQSVQRAFKMFKHLGLKGASESALKIDRRERGAEKRKWAGSQRQISNSGFRKRRRVSKAHGVCHRVFIGNLNPSVKYTFDMFRQLFHSYKISWITLKSCQTDGPDPKTYAFVLAASRQEADGIVKEFNGFRWFGRSLVLYVKEKMANKMKDEANNLDSSISSKDNSGDREEMGSDLPDMKHGPEGSKPDLGRAMPGLEPAMPGLEWAMPGLESAMPGLEPAMPGLELAMPGLEPAMPGLESAMPGLESAMPGLERAMPGLEPSMPGLESAIPGLEPAMPGLERAMPGLESAMPDLEQILPPLEPALPPLESALPELEPVPPLENLRVQRSFEVPTVLVTNIKDYVNEAALKSLFAVYSPKGVRIVHSQYGRKKAFIELGSVENVRRAVRNLNQSLYDGQRIKVDVPFNMPELRQAVLGSEHLSTSASGAVTLSEVLKMRGNLLQILQVSDSVFHLGQQVEVLITAVISDKFFWGQVTDMKMAEKLQRITDGLNTPTPTEMASGHGRCKARFQGDGKWYRAWVMRTSSHLMTQHCRVFYLDYGNTAHIPWAHTAKACEAWYWDTPPLALPFTLIEGVPNLKDKELTRITVEVNALGSLEEGNMVVVKALSLVPNVKAEVSGIVRTVIM